MISLLINRVFFSIGAHMRRASAELAERRRASFGSRGENAWEVPPEVG